MRRRPSVPHHELDQLTGQTGGAARYPAAIEDIDAVALDIAQQIRTQYTIAYAPLNQALDGTYRTVRVTVAGGDPNSGLIDDPARKWASAGIACTV